MKNITPRNDKGKKHGYWESYRTNGSVYYKCFFNNGKVVGYSEFYWMNGNELTNKKYYI